MADAKEDFGSSDKPGASWGRVAQIANTADRKARILLRADGDRKDACILPVCAYRKSAVPSASKSAGLGIGLRVRKPATLLQNEEGLCGALALWHKFGRRTEQS